MEEDEESAFKKASALKIMVCESYAESEGKGDSAGSFSERLQKILKDLDQEEMLQPTAWRYGCGF